MPGATSIPIYRRRLTLINRLGKIRMKITAKIFLTPSHFGHLCLFILPWEYFAPIFARGAVCLSVYQLTQTWAKTIFQNEFYVPCSFEAFRNTLHQERCRIEIRQWYSPQGDLHSDKERRNFVGGYSAHRSCLLPGEVGMVHFEQQAALGLKRAGKGWKMSVCQNEEDWIRGKCLWVSVFAIWLGNSRRKQALLQLERWQPANNNTLQSLQGGEYLLRRRWTELSFCTARSAQEMEQSWKFKPVWEKSTALRWSQNEAQKTV